MTEDETGTESCGISVLSSEGASPRHPYLAYRTLYKALETASCPDYACNCALSVPGSPSRMYQEQ